MKFLPPEIAPVPELIILLCAAVEILTVFLPSVLPLPAPRSGFPTSLAFCGSSSLHIVRPPPHCRVPAPLRLLPSAYISFTCGAEIPLWPPAPQASSKSSLGSFLAAPQSLWISFQGFGLHLFRPQPMFDPHSHLGPMHLSLSAFLLISIAYPGPTILALVSCLDVVTCCLRKLQCSWTCPLLPVPRLGLTFTHGSAVAQSIHSLHIPSLGSQAQHP